MPSVPHSKLTDAKCVLLDELCVGVFMCAMFTLAIPPLFPANFDSYPTQFLEGVVCFNFKLLSFLLFMINCI